MLIVFMLTMPAHQGGIVGLALAVGFPVLAIALAYGLSPGGYSVSQDGRLQILRRWFGSKTFRIDSVAATSARFGLGGIRLAGSGGAFGWYGWFWRKGTGRYRAYVTHRARLVLCNGPDGLVVISPDDPAAFVTAAQP